MKKFFSLQTDSKNYGYPLIKIVISVLIIFFSICRNSIFHITSKPLNIAVAVLCFLATVASILCIYISVAELFYVRKNRKGSISENKMDSSSPFDLERVIDLTNKCDIIEFEIMSKGNLIKIGTSANSKSYSGPLFDKKFYIGQDEYPTAKEFEKALFRYTEDGKINVIAIDGVKPKNDFE